jgi:DNA-binding Xre family transcriptional regulator
VTGKVNAATFDRMLAERGLSATAFCRRFGVSSATVAKIRRGQPIDVKAIERIGQQLRLTAPKPEIAELLAS